MEMETADPLAGQSTKLLSRVSYLLADRLTQGVSQQLKQDQSAWRSEAPVLATDAASAGIKYTFEIPSDQAKGKATLISLFLYDVHEDNALRHSAIPAWRAQYPVSAGKRPIRLCYLITCWFGKKDDDKSSEQDERYAMRVSDALLGALIGLRGQPLIPGAYCRILPPSEKLFSLGQFWQALEDSRPRLTLGLTITVPYAPPKRPGDADLASKVNENPVLHLRPAESGVLSTLDDNAERIVRLVAIVAKIPQSADGHGVLRGAEANLMDALSEEAKRWRDPKVQPSLLSLLSVSMAQAVDFVGLKHELEARALLIRWRDGTDTQGALPVDVAIVAALTQRRFASGVSIDDAVSALDRLAQKGWAHWQDARVSSGEAKKGMSINDMMALSAVFGCIALAHSLKKQAPDGASLAGVQEETQ